MGGGSAKATPIASVPMPIDERRARFQSGRLMVCIWASLKSPAISTGC
jgi:hypothetical protein